MRWLFIVVLAVLVGCVLSILLLNPGDQLPGATSSGTGTPATPLPAAPPNPSGAPPG